MADRGEAWPSSIRSMQAANASSISRSLSKGMIVSSTELSTISRLPRGRVSSSISVSAIILGYMYCKAEIGTLGNPLLFLVKVSCCGECQQDQNSIYLRSLLRSCRKVWTSCLTSSTNFYLGKSNCSDLKGRLDVEKVGSLLCLALPHRLHSKAAKPRAG